MRDWLTDRLDHLIRRHEFICTYVFVLPYAILEILSCLQKLSSLRMWIVWLEPPASFHCELWVCVCVSCADKIVREWTRLKQSSVCRQSIIKGKVTCQWKKMMITMEEWWCGCHRNRRHEYGAQFWAPWSLLKYHSCLLVTDSPCR